MGEIPDVVAIVEPAIGSAGELPQLSDEPLSPTDIVVRAELFNTLSAMSIAWSKVFLLSPTVSIPLTYNWHMDLCKISRKRENMWSYQALNKGSPLFVLSSSALETIKMHANARFRHTRLAKFPSLSTSRWLIQTRAHKLHANSKSGAHKYYIHFSKTTEMQVKMAAVIYLGHEGTAVFPIYHLSFWLK